MTHEARVLSYQQAQTFYDWMGAKQDWQAFYEEKATRDLIAHSSFDNAQAVFEFGSRVTVEQTAGSLPFAAASGSYDRFVSTYVADLLSDSDIALLLSEAHRLLIPEGHLCLVSLTHGATGVAHLVTGLWTRVHARWPALVGGCRPLSLRPWLPVTHWQVGYRNIVTAFGIPSEVI